MAAVILALHVMGWGVLLTLVVPEQIKLGAPEAVALGLGVTAYSLGLRHAFDADHIAAIDNTTRKLLHEGKRSPSVGFFFSLGHSTVVFVLCALLATGARTVASQTLTESSGLRPVMEAIGTGISGVFLCLIGILNLVIFRGTLNVLRTIRQGGYDEAALTEHLERRGFMNRFFGRTTRLVHRPWQMYLVGLLFGLGFDTATEVSLLVLAGGVTAVQLPWYAVLTLPVLFAAGMSLLDSIDSCLMTFAYGWAYQQPTRKAYYNLVITGSSVALAMVIGLLQLTSLFVQWTRPAAGPLLAITELDTSTIGFAVVLLFIMLWAFAVGRRRFRSRGKPQSLPAAPGAREEKGQELTPQ